MSIKWRPIAACLTIELAIVMALSLSTGTISLAKAASPGARTARQTDNPGAGLTRAQKLKRALSACRKEKTASKRRACARKARARYGRGSKRPQTGGPTSTAPKTGEPTSKTPKPGEPTTPPRTEEEKRIGYTRVTLECPVTAVVGKTFTIDGTAAGGALIAISYTTPTSAGTQRAQADNSGHFKSEITAREAGAYMFLASSEGVTSPECTTTVQ
jgi:hypothetical protein